MSYFYVYRNIVLGLCLLLTIPALGLIAHWTQGSSLDKQILGFEGMGLFISSLSFLIFPIMLVLPEFRKNAFILYIYAEMIIVLLMWVLWMTAAILVIEQRQTTYPLGNCNFLPALQLHWCDELFAIQGLSITIFVFLIKYLLILLIFSFVNHSRGVYVWTTSVKDLQLTLPKVQLTHTSQVDANGNPVKVDGSLFGSATGYPPPQQQTVGPYSQPGSYNQSQYSNSSSQLAPQPAPIPMQVNQSVSYSQRPPQGQSGNTLPPKQTITPAQPSLYGHYNPSPVPAVPQV